MERPVGMPRGAVREAGRASKKGMASAPQTHGLAPEEVQEPKGVDRNLGR